MEEVLKIYNDQERKYILVIDDENSVISDLIYHQLLYKLRRRALDYSIIKMSKSGAADIIDEYNLKEFPSVLYFRDNTLINKVAGFKYGDYYK